MSTYVRLVDQTIRYTTPRIIPSFHRRKKKAFFFFEKSQRPRSAKRPVVSDLVFES